jgi:hypothetical protein
LVKKSVPVALIELAGMAAYLIWLQHMLVTHLLRTPEDSWVKRLYAAYQDRKRAQERARLEVWTRRESSVEPSV